MISHTVMKQAETEKTHDSGASQSCLSTLFLRQVRAQIARQQAQAEEAATLAVAGHVWGQGARAQVPPPPPPPPPFGCQWS